jgi:hypothetical protein
MILGVLSGLVGTIGTTLGIGGLGAAGALLFAFLAGVGLRSALSVAGIAALIAVGIYGTGFLKGGASCRSAYELAAARAQAAALGRQVLALNSTIKRQNELDAQRIKEMADDDLRISQLETIISARVPSDMCPVAVTARELRGIKAIGSARARR